LDQEGPLAKRRSYKKTSQIEGFAEDLGRLLGSAAAKADRWLGQRQTIIKHLTDVRDTASQLLANLGHQAQAAVTGKRRGRPAGSKNLSVVRKLRGSWVAPAPRKRRKMSAKARKAISDAQKARWAKQKAGEKKK
jgi:hypothetical protein